MKRAEMERILLAEAVKNNSIDFLVAENVSPDYFESHKNAAIALWTASQNMEGQLPSRESVEEKSTDPKNSAFKNYKTVKSWDPRPDDVKECVLKLREYHAQDEVNKQLYNMKKILSDDPQNGWYKIMTEMPVEFYKIQNIMNAQKAVDFAENADDRLKYVIERAERSASNDWKILFANKEMNEYFGGYEPGFYMYVARTGVGKTWSCLLDLWHTWAHSKDKPNVGIFSLEMDANRVGLRLDTFGSHFSSFDLQKGLIRRADSNAMTPKEIAAEQKVYKGYLENLIEGSTKGERGKFRIWTGNMFDGPITPRRIEALCREENLDFVVIDQLELVDSDDKITDERLRLNDVARAFKQMAERLGIPVLVPHQMNRETLKVKEVTAANVAGSDGPARHAEFVCYLTRDDVSNIMHYTFLKSRNAPVNKRFALQWDYADGKYKPLTEAEVADVSTSYEEAVAQDQEAEDLEEANAEREMAEVASGW